jgi:hypothetical protein
LYSEMWSIPFSHETSTSAAKADSVALWTARLKPGPSENTSNYGFRYLARNA